MVKKCLKCQKCGGHFGGGELRRKGGGRGDQKCKKYKKCHKYYALPLL